MFFTTRSEPFALVHGRLEYEVLGFDQNVLIVIVLIRIRGDVLRLAIGPPRLLSLIIFIVFVVLVFVGGNVLALLLFLVNATLRHRAAVFAPRPTQI